MVGGGLSGRCDDLPDLGFELVSVVVVVLLVLGPQCDRDEVREGGGGGE